MQMNDIPAFPRPSSGTVQYAQTGMTLRDYFAAKALKSYSADTPELMLDNAKHAYAQADAMMKAREA